MLNDVVSAFHLKDCQALNAACMKLLWEFDFENNLKECMACFDGLYIDIFGVKFARTFGAFDSFNNDFSCVLPEVYSKVSEFDAKAIYFEYFDDGGVGFSNFGISSRYEDVPDFLGGVNDVYPDWPDFLVCDYIDGPAVNVFLKLFDQEGYVDYSVEYFFYKWYSHVLMMNEVFFIVNHFDKNIPFAFARHEFPYVRLVR